MEVNNFCSSVLFVLFHEDEPPILSKQNKHKFPLCKETVKAGVALIIVALCHCCSAAG